MTNQSILMVEDDGVWTKFAVQHIASLGYKDIDVATNKHDAMDILSKRNYAIVIIDLRIPNGAPSIENGLDVISWLNLHKHATAVIVVSGVDDADVVKQAIDAGAQLYVTKEDFARSIGTKIQAAQLYYHMQKEAELVMKLVSKQ